jgi:hypothetical protein
MASKIPEGVRNSRKAQIAAKLTPHVLSGGAATALIGGDPLKAPMFGLATTFQNAEGPQGDWARQYLADNGGDMIQQHLRSPSEPGGATNAQIYVDTIREEAGTAAAEAATAAVKKTLSDPKEIQTAIDAGYAELQDLPPDQRDAKLKEWSDVFGSEGGKAAVGGLASAVEGLDDETKQGLFGQFKDIMAQRNPLNAVDGWFNQLLGAAGLAENEFGQYMSGLHPLLKGAVMVSALALPVSMLMGSRTGTAIAGLALMTGLGSGLLPKPGEEAGTGSTLPPGGVDPAIDPATGQSADTQVSTNMQTSRQQAESSQAIQQATQAASGSGDYGPMMNLTDDAQFMQAYEDLASKGNQLNLANPLILPIQQRYNALKGQTPGM